MIYVHLDEPTIATQSALGSVISAAAITTANQNAQTFALPVQASIDKSCLWQEVERFWSIPEEFLASVRGGNFVKKLGAGAAATVFLAPLYGVNVAVKVWDIGTRNMPPADFDQELSIMAAIHHPNLVRFVGAVPGRGQGALVMEFVSGGSLDKYLKFKQPDDEDLAKAESESRMTAPYIALNGNGSGENTILPTDESDKIVIRNLNLSGDPNVSIIHSASGTTETFRVKSTDPPHSSPPHSLSGSSMGHSPADISRSFLRGVPGGSNAATPRDSTDLSSLSDPKGLHVRQPSGKKDGPSSSKPASFLGLDSLDTLSLMIPPSSNVPTPLSGPSNFMNRIPIALDIAKALLYLHEANLIHRDVKTLNVLINRESLSTRLSDFGEAATRDAALNEMVGSTQWMAPEVSLSEVYSSKADVFSFGLVLYELLVEGYPVRTMHMIAEGMIPKIPTHLSLSFPAFVRLIHACTLQNPDKRPTMFSVVRELEKIQSVTQIRKVRAIR